MNAKLFCCIIGFDTSPNLSFFISSRYLSDIELEAIQPIFPLLVDETELELIQTKLKIIIDDFGKEAGENVKALERSTHHDVQAVEYYLRDNFKKDKVLNQLIELSQRVYQLHHRVS